MSNQDFLTVKTLVKCDASTAWQVFTDPELIVDWNQASADWHCPQASNNLERGGEFSYTMAARDGSSSFDLEGQFDEVDPPFTLDYTLADGRKVEVRFEPGPRGQTEIIQRFQPEQDNSLEMQQSGWQAILDSYAKYASEM